jgi:hypothetical protein
LEKIIEIKTAKYGNLEVVMKVNKKGPNCGPIKTRTPFADWEITQYKNFAIDCTTPVEIHYMDGSTKVL